MLLYLLRHGDAVDSATLHDSERPLTERGSEQSRTAAAFFQRSKISFGLIITSPLLRAKQMAQPAKELLAVKQTFESEYLVPGSNPNQLFDLLSNQSADSILLVGHEPHLSTTISLLICGDTSAQIEMKKASCACVEIAKPIEAGKGNLKWLITSEHMKTLR
ncbi:MAG TPA: phosphohistidine phosphatase SixA [Bacteroidota bacterium]|nr:phosphohistidine phosphatase SixA [Bacteroidota bacterium]